MIFLSQAALERLWSNALALMAEELSMRALSIRQPYAELILRGEKTIEYSQERGQFRMHIKNGSAQSAEPSYIKNSWDAARDQVKYE